MDKGTKVEMQDSFAAWMELYDEMDALQERRRPTRRRLGGVLAEAQSKVGTNSEKKQRPQQTRRGGDHNATTRKRQHLEHNCDSLLNLAKENGWAKVDREEVKLKGRNEKLQFVVAQISHFLHVSRNGSTVSLSETLLDF